ncbi:hypothetical protein CRG98_000861, partial [Punica granatum]
MSSTYGLFGPLLLSLLLFSSSTSASHLNRIPSLRIAPDSFLQDSGNAVTESILNETQTFFFDQTLDHFNYMPESYATFKHKYVINFKYWGGANSSAPIFAFLGGEEPHRFYGESIPFGLSLEEALNNSNTRGHFNSAQTLADYAEETSETCYETIKRSWSAIDRVASKQHGLQYLTETFNTCEPLSNASELKDYLISMYATAAQYNDPFTTPVAKLCDAVNSNGSSSILNKIFAGVVATMGNSTNSSCYDITPPRNASQTTLGWSWQ